MKKTTILIFGILISLSVQSQKWQQLFGMAGRYDYSMNVIEHYDDGYLISGNIYLDGGNYHGWLIKTDINGGLLWDKVITQLPDKAMIVKTLFDPVGNIYVFGWLYQEQPHEFPFIIKLDACGELQWCRLLAIEGYDFGYFTDALFLDNGDLLGLAFMPDMNYNALIFLFRISPDGNLIWKKEYASLDNHPYYGNRIGQEIKKFGDLFVVSGYVYSPYPNGNPDHVYLRPMFIGVDKNFEEQWIVEFGIQDSLLGKAESSIAISDSLFMGVGRYRFINENGDMDMKSWLMYYNKIGEEVRHRMINDEQFGPEVLESCLYEAEYTESDKYLLSAGYVTNDLSAKGDLVLDTAGNIYKYEIREHTIGGGNIYLTKTFDKKYILNADYQLPSQTSSDILHYKINDNLEQDTVYPGNYTYDSLCKQQIQSGLIDLSGCGVITSIDEIPTLEQYRKNLQSIGITASPNPSGTGEVLLELENTGSFTNMELMVSDIYGKQIHTESILQQQGAVRLKTGQWPAGMYVATVLSNGEVKGKTKFVVR
ncbi:MAG: T9SS type A sorting domain-containing protein [Bacteroidales bacterium]|nr:T9SS type A sorting domain-containing protein [Bacteroidales bacterium]